MNVLLLLSLFAAQTVTSTSTEVAEEPVAVEEEEPAPAKPSNAREAEGVEEIVVTGSRTESRISDAPMVVDLVRRQEIEDSGAENLADILENVPGVQVTQNLGRAGVEIQGLDPQYTLILVDGQRLAGRVGGTLDLNRLSAERIERVEIVKGAVSALYGADALAGVVNIITRKSKKPFEGELHLSYGSFNMLDGTAEVGLVRDKLNLRITGGFHRGDSYQLASPERLGGDPSTSGPQFNEGSGEARAEYALTDDEKLVLRGDYLFRDAESVAAVPVAMRGESTIFQTFYQGNRTENYSTALTYEKRFEDTAAKLQLVGYFNGWREQFLQDRRSVKGDIPVETNERLGQLTAQYDEAMGASLVTIGSELLIEELEATERICRPLEPDACLADTSGRVTGKSANNAARVRFAWFLQDEWTISEEPRLVLVPGIRADVDSLFGTHPTPKVTLRFDPIEEVVLRASYGFGFRAPSFRELYLTFSNPSANYNISGNPDLDPETSRSVNVSVEVKPSRVFSASINFYRNDLDQLIDYELLRPGSFGQLGLFRFINIAKAHTQGFESNVMVKPLEGLALGAGYTFLDAANETADVTLAGRAKHRVDAKATFTETWLDSTWFAHFAFVGPREYPDIENPLAAAPKSGAYAMLDARVEKRFGEHLEVFFGVDNILDAADFQFLLIRPRTFYAGITGRM